MSEENVSDGVAPYQEDAPSAEIITLERPDKKRVIDPSKPLPPVKKVPPQISFNRLELSEILRVYGRRVADGDWRDYAMDFRKDRAVFSIFKRASEMPLFQIEKNPKLAKRQGEYSVTNTSGMVLKRGHDLRQVLKVFETKKHLRVVD